MPKFNVKKLQGLGEELAKESETNTNTYKVGQGLLSEVSRDKAVEDDIIYLRRNQIVRNDKNYYSINDIGGLAWSISVFGLIQPLHVKQMENGQYKLLGGERRLTAIEKLIEDESVENWTEDTLIKCIEKDPDDIELPLDSELKEFLAIITTNKESRKYTDSDRAMEIREWKRIIEHLRENGVESIPYMNEAGEKMELAIKGEATRNILSRATGLSRGSINNFEKVENRGSQKLKDAVRDGKVTIHTAAEMVDKLNQKQQEELLEETDNVVALEDVRRKADDETHENVISTQRFQRDIKNVLKGLKKREIILNDEEKKLYDDCIDKLNTLLCQKEN